MHEGALFPCVLSRATKLGVPMASFLDGLCVVMIPYFLLGWLCVAQGIVAESFALLIVHPSLVFYFPIFCFVGLDVADDGIYEPSQVFDYILYKFQCVG